VKKYFITLKFTWKKRQKLTENKRNVEKVAKYIPAEMKWKKLFAGQQGDLPAVLARVPVGAEARAPEDQRPVQVRKVPAAPGNDFIKSNFSGSATPCASPLPGPPFFRLYFFVHHPVNWDDRHLLARAMASKFTVTWQFSQREQFFCYGSNSTPFYQV
jgi:hypothetical protein